MSKLLASLGGNAGAVAAGAVVVGVLAVGAWIGSKRDEAAILTPTLAVQTQPEPKITVTPATPEIKDAPKVADVAPVPAPAFDEVRREPDGMTVVAGRALPGAVVKLLKDGAEIATTTADGSGKFATLAMIAPDGEGHVLSLIQSLNGEDVASADEIILAPTVAPVLVAALDEIVAQSDTPDVAETVAVPEIEGTEVAVAPEVTDVAKPTDKVVQGVVPTAADVKTETVATTQDAVAVSETQRTPAVETVAEGDDQTEPSKQPVVATEQAAPQTETPNPEPEPTVAVLKSSAEGVELLNPTAPDVMDTVALDTISYSDAGDVQLAGRAQADTQAVRVYLDNDAVINLPVDDQGRWRGDVPNVDEGIYTLRVDEVAADGTVTSRVETPFKREAPEVLAQASEAQDGPIKAITVQTGATLWAIARERYGDGRLYVRVVKANESSIRDPDLIYPGQIFDLPE